MHILQREKLINPKCFLPVMTTTVISLGGSIIVPDQIDVPFLQKFRKLCLEYVKKGNRLILVCGGGSTCRKYQQAASELVKTTGEDLDWVGIMATRLNAELVRVLFKGHGHEKVAYDPGKKVLSRKKIIIAAGHEPGVSTDHDTVLLAKQFKAHLIINASNITHVYTKDPRKYPDARRLLCLTWKEYLRLVATSFTSGMHAPFDPEASRLAQKNKMKVVVINGRNLENLGRLLGKKTFEGTVIG